MFPGFLADIMLKKLARWMRMVGYDTVYPDFTEDEKMLELAKETKRILLTQDVELASRASKRGVRALLVPRDVEVESQVAFVLGELKLSIDFPNKTLCPQCNGELEIVGRERVGGNANVPAGVLERNSSFWLCESCKKVYWEGSHWGRIKKSVEKIKKELLAD
ncbi:MAG: Mut7-C RNAse domain-containing protein [Candidatus Micrarchaeota archaeon]